MPRIFTGLEIPADVAQSLAALRGGLPGARWIDAENYHVTLRFIGDVDESIAHEVASLLGRVRRGPFELYFDDLGRSAAVSRVPLWRRLGRSRRCLSCRPNTSDSCSGSGSSRKGASIRLTSHSPGCAKLPTARSRSIWRCGRLTARCRSGFRALFCSRRGRRSAAALRGRGRLSARRVTGPMPA